MKAKELAALHERAAPAEAWSVGSYTGLLDSPGVHIKASEDGFAIARLAAGEAEILMVAVVQEARRRGLASALMRGLERKLAKAGAQEVFLEVAVSNGGARALYAKSGFCERARRKNYYNRGNGQREDALILAKRLQPA